MGETRRQDHFLLLSAVLFIIGMMGVLIRRNMIIIFMCVELMVTAANITLVAFGWENDSLGGQSFVLFTIAVARPKRRSVWRSSWRSAAGALGRCRRAMR